MPRRTFRIVVVASVLLGLAVLPPNVATAAPSAATESFGVMYSELPSIPLDGDGPSQAASPTFFPTVSGSNQSFWEVDGYTAQPDGVDVRFQFTSEPRTGTRTPLSLVQVDRACNNVSGLATGVALVRDAVVVDHMITRLDAVYDLACYGWATGGHIFGELRVNEPSTTPLRPSSRELVIPASSQQTPTTTYPVLFGPGTAGTVDVAALRLTGSGAAHFRLSHDTCSRQQVSAYSPCGVDVTYLPGTSSDSAALVAVDSSGRTLSSTALSGALLPGSSYWCEQTHCYSSSSHPLTLSHGSTKAWPFTTTIQLEPVPAVPGSATNFPQTSIEIDADHPLAAGRYALRGNSHVLVTVAMGGLNDYHVAYAGVLRVTQGFTATPDRELGEITRFAFSYELYSEQAHATFPGGTPELGRGSVSVNTAQAPRAPGSLATSRLGDFTGDGLTDIAVYRPSTHQWFVRGRAPVTYGVAGDVPEPGDYDGDGVTDVAVYRPSTHQWFVRGRAPVTYGVAGDVPEPGDYDGDGVTDVAVYRPSTHQWFVRGRAPVTYGVAGDVPEPGDYDGDGVTDVAVYRPSTHQWFVRGQFSATWGTAGDTPVPGAYDDTGVSELAVYRPSSHQWLVRGRDAVTLGAAGDQLVPGAYPFDNASGFTTVPAVFHPSTGQWSVQGLRDLPTVVTYGRAGDVPV